MKEIIFYATQANRVYCYHWQTRPDSKVHGANIGPIWDRQDPDGPHVGPMNFAMWDSIYVDIIGLCDLVTYLIPFSFPLRWYCPIYPCIAWRKVDNMALDIDRSCICWENIVF